MDETYIVAERRSSDGVAEADPPPLDLTTEDPVDDLGTLHLGFSGVSHDARFRVGTTMDISVDGVPPAFDSTHASAVPMVTSFNISTSFREPPPRPAPVQVPIVPSLPREVEVVVDDDVTFELLDNGTQRGGVMLADSIGFTYTKKRETEAGKVTWRCSVRSAAHTCKAGVTQTGQEYTRTAYGHDHPAQPGTAERIRKTKAIHQKAKENVFTSAANIMEEVMQGTVDLKAPAATRPVPVNVVRSANYQRSKGRPKAPTDLDFDVDMAWVDPDFLRKDLHVSGARHLIFATSPQLELLSTASTIFCDATFKVVSPPFYQLFSVHAFLHDANGQEVKQVPLVFALMSRRRKKDNKAVFRAVLELTPSLAPEEMVTDFEDRGNPGQALEAMETVQETGHQHPPAPQATWTRGSSNWSEKVIPSPTPPFLGPTGSRLRLPHPKPTRTYGFPAKVLRTPAFTGT